MAETALTASQADALSGVTDSDLDFTYLTIGESPYYTGAYRCWEKFVRLVKAISALRVYQDGDLTFGVRAGRYMNGASAVSYVGASAQSLTNNATNHIYLTAAGTLTVNTTGFPSADVTPHLPLATIVTSAGSYDNDDITDYRGRTLFRVVRAPRAVRPALKAWGAVYFSGRPADDELLTINGRKYETDTDGDFPQAAGDVQCDLNGNSSIDEDITDIAATINGDAGREVDAVADTTNDILWLTARTTGVAGNSLTLATALTNTTANNATLADGDDAAPAQIVAIRHTIAANEATGAWLRFDTGLTSIQTHHLTFEDSSLEVASDTEIAISGGVITIFRSGGTWADGDVLNLLAIGTL